MKLKIDTLVTIVGEKPGKTVTVMAGVHGNEVCGPQAFEKLIPELKITSGKVHFVIGNPNAVAENKRQTEMNLNRAFRPNVLMPQEEKESYERRRAFEIMPLLEESDALLDVHSSMTEGSPVFMICEPHSYDLASRLPADIVCHGFDAIEPGGTDYYMNRVGGMGICIECGFHEDPEAPKRAEEAIKAFLILMGCVEGPEPEKREQSYFFAHYLYHTKVDFKRAKEFKDFEPVKKGDLVGYDNGEEVRVIRDGLILFCRDRMDPATPENPRPNADKEGFIICREE